MEMDFACCLSYEMGQLVRYSVKPKSNLRFKQRNGDDYTIFYHNIN